MSTTVSATEQDSAGLRKKLLTAYRVFRKSVSLSFALFGVVLVLIAPVVETVHGVFGGMFGIWGATFVLIGVAVYGFFWAVMKYGKLSVE